MKQKLKKAVVLLTVAAAALTTIYILWHIRVDDSRRVVELGQQVSENPADYAEGFDFSLRLCQVDSSGVAQNKPGEYALILTHGPETYRIPILIRDTIPPKIVKREGNTYLAAGREVAVTELIESVEDADSKVTLVAQLDGQIEQTLVFPECKEQSVTLIATDSSGNETVEAVDFYVDTAPEFSNLKDIYIAKDSESATYLEAVQATDMVDGDLTQEIRVDDTGVNLQKEGDYQAFYDVTDSYGLSTRETVDVHVLSKGLLEQKIGDRDLNWRDEIIIGADNKYDAGAAATGTMEQQYEYLLPTAVHLYFEYPYNPWIQSSSGSGFILYMDEVAVYICTNYHVISHEDSVCTCYFYDGTTAPMEEVGYSEDYDIAILRVRRENLSDDTYGTLMSVHLNQNEFDIAKTGGKDIFLQKIDKNGVDYRKTGKTISFGEIPFRLLPVETLASDLSTYHGSSGSGIFDNEGNLIAMACGYEKYDWGEAFHHIGMEDIRRVFEEKTGISLYSE